MPASSHNDVLDALLNEIGANCVVMMACAGEPTSRAEADTFMLAQQTGMVAGDFPVTDRGAGGREIDVAAKSAVSIANSGSFDHVAYCDATRVLHVKPGTLQVLTAGGTVNFPTTKIGAPDPTAV